MYDISASIVAYKTNISELQSAILCLLNTDLKVKVYIVDNSPNDDLLAHLELGPSLEYIHSHSNPGFGAAHNKAILKAINEKSKYHIIINPDISFQNGVLEELYNFMEQNPDVGNVMPKVLYEDGALQRLCKLLPTPIDLFGRRFLGGVNLFNEMNSKYELHMYSYDRIVDIPNLSGCFMFLRASILNKVGGFDEGYFMYLEDVDLNRRIGQIAQTVCNPNVSIVHGFKRESYKSSNLLKHHILSAIRYFNKWGWIFDKQRKVINKITLEKLGA